MGCAVNEQKQIIPNACFGFMTASVPACILMYPHEHPDQLSFTGKDPGHLFLTNQNFYPLTYTPFTDLPDLKLYS